MFPQIMPFIASLLTIDRAVAGGSRHQRGGLKKIVCYLFADGQENPARSSWLLIERKIVSEGGFEVCREKTTSGGLQQFYHPL